LKPPKTHQFLENPDKTLLVGTSSCGLKKSLTMRMPILLTIPGKRLKIKGKRLHPWRFIFPVSHGHFFCMPWGGKNPESPMICPFLYPIFVAWQKIPSISGHAHVFLRYSPYNHPTAENTFSKLLLTSPSHKMSINIPSNHQKNGSHKIPSGKLTVCYGKWPCFMGKSTISMAIFQFANC